MDANPAIAQAFQTQSIPSVFAVIGGRPLPLFQGALPEQQVRAFIDELLKVALANGVTGTVAGAAEPAPALDPADVRLADPRMDAAYDAIESGDWTAARAAYQSIIDVSPADRHAKAGLALVGVFERVDGADHAQVLTAADRSPDDLAAQELAADVLVLDGRPVEAFARLTGAIRFTSGADRDRLRAAPAGPLRGGRTRGSVRDPSPARPGERAVLSPGRFPSGRSRAAPSRRYRSVRPQSGPPGRRSPLDDVFLLRLDVLGAAS